MKHLRYSLFYCDEHKHPQQVMRELGITYLIATPHSLGDQWWFWCCKNVPDPLPKYLAELGLDPMKCIGCGLSMEEASLIQCEMEAAVVAPQETHRPESPGRFLGGRKMDEGKKDGTISIAGGTATVGYSGLDKVEEINPNVLADILSGDNDTRKKINEVIKVVNRMVDILNGRLQKEVGKL